ncbi:MAG: DUF748 domain-containing protein [Flavobacteriales bacterium]
MSTPDRRRWRRRLLMALLILVLLLCLVAFLLPYLLKRYIEDNSEQWIDRKVTIGSIVLNPFTFTYAVNNVTCYEPGSEQVFVSWKRVGVRADLLDGFRNNDWRFRGLRLEEPYFHIVQHGDRFNFTDLMELGGTPSTEGPDTTVVLFSMRDIAMTGARIDYESDLLHGPVQVIGLMASCNEISSQRARMDFALGFELGGGGRTDAKFMIDTQTSAYAIQAQLKGFELIQVLPYLQDLFSCKSLSGTLDLDLDLVDNFADTSGLALSAGMRLSGVDLTDPHGDTLFSLATGRARLDTLVASDGSFEVGEVHLDGAALAFRMLADGTDNWSRWLKMDTVVVAGDSAAYLHASESNVLVMLADYVTYLGQQVVANEYTAQKASLTRSSVRFEDHTPARPFRYTVSGINITSERVTSDQEVGEIDVSATLQETGALVARFSFDPKDLRNMVMALDVKGLALDHLDAYGRWYAAHPLEGGVLNYTSNTSITSGVLDSRNHLQVDGLVIGRKVEEHASGIYVLPLRLAAGLLKDVKGVVELDVPVSGDLKDPQFRVWPIIWQVLKNLVLKAASAPGRMLMRAVQGNDEAELERVRFAFLQREPGRSQTRTLEQLSRALLERPDIVVDLIPLVDTDLETQEVAVFHVKQAFLFGDKAVLENADSARIFDLSVRDTAFEAFVEDRSPELVGKPTYERCLSIAGKETCASEAKELENARRARVLSTTSAVGVPPARIRFRDGSTEELAGQRGAPGYRFVYDVAAEDP